MCRLLVCSALGPLFVASAHRNLVRWPQKCECNCHSQRINLRPPSGRANQQGRFNFGSHGCQLKPIVSARPEARADIAPVRAYFSPERKPSELARSGSRGSHPIAPLATYRRPKLLSRMRGPASQVKRATGANRATCSVSVSARESRVPSRDSGLRDSHRRLILNSGSPSDETTLAAPASLIKRPLRCVGDRSRRNKRIAKQPSGAQFRSFALGGSRRNWGQPSPTLRAAPLSNCKRRSYNKHSTSRARVPIAPASECPITSFRSLEISISAATLGVIGEMDTRFAVH